MQPHWHLVIFDCDGVLVDSEPIAHHTLVDALGELGLKMTVEEAFALFRGGTGARVVAIIEERLGRPLPQGFFPAWRERLYAAFRAAPVRAVAGVEKVLESLTIPVCVVSNGPFPKMRTTLEVTGLLPRFEGRMFSPDLGLPGKPKPDLFLAAAAAFNIDAAQAVVIEDSLSGVEAAHAAGMTVFGYAGEPYVDAADLEAAGARVFHHMRELPALLSSS